MKKLRETTGNRLKSILEELQNFAQENNITLREAIDIQLIDSLRGISHRILETGEMSREKTRII
ncbi:MAG: hypothetical protein JW976_02780 [Syntrophaceae bacterium]|nr:hypothetical protein [Syntrophaceae bacterium]